MPGTIYYKVYCGSNGKFYTYKSEERAKKLFYALSLQNKHTYILKIENDKKTEIASYR